ncbi:MAG: AprI/Inh family metalloprotease inhibitor [Methylobacteriaceae bacterium]|nr:AprI/Inh family metalloprotease inhibitor [Methylobacteriaceae bacterium]
MRISGKGGVRGAAWATFGLAAALTLLPAMGAALGASADAAASVRSAAGQWDMSLNDTNRKCRVILRPDPADKSYAIAMPAGCRRAMPILSSVLGWTADPDALKLTDESGNAVLQFTSATDASTLVATGPEGETYNLVAAALGPRLQSPTVKPVQVAQAAAPAAGAAAAPAATAPSAVEVAGRYDILRAGPKDTGCMLTLDDKAKGPKGGKKAILAPACRDQGIVIFDPAGWRLEKGRLTLTAKKGHETHLDFQADGTWQKDPKEGAALILKKM